MFAISSSDTYVWPISIHIPVDGGRYDKLKMRARFKRLPQSRIDEILKQGREPVEGDEAFVEEVWVDWEKFVDAQGKEVEYSEAARRYFLDNVAGGRSAIIAAWFETISAQGARRKN